MTALLVVPVGVFAGPLGATVWDLTGFNTGGTFSWAGGNADPLTGSGIQVSDVTGDSTPLHASPPDPGLTIVNGSLTFSTGSNSYQGTAVNGHPGTGWVFGASSGGPIPASLDIWGCITGLTSNVCDGTNNVVLLSDSFQSVSILQQGTNFDVVFGGIEGTINPLVAGYFGLNNDTQFAASQFLFTIQSAAAPGSAITDVNTTPSTSALSGTIDAGAVGVPEDWGVAINFAFFGLGLAIFATVRRLGYLRTVVSHL